MLKENTRSRITPLNSIGRSYKRKEETLTEDLYSEHSLLDRILLIYEYIITQNTINNKTKKIIYKLAYIIHEFIELFHEKNEEKYIFPFFRTTPSERRLVDTLIKQHKLSRKKTSLLLRLTRKDFLTENEENIILSTLQSFVHMYRAHEAFEDTEIFRNLRKVLSFEEYEKIQETLEKLESKTLGYSRYLRQISRIEKTLGINDLRYYNN